METRSENFAKYRDFIRGLSPSVFKEDGSYGANLSEEEIHRLHKAGYTGSGVALSGQVSHSRPALDLDPDDHGSTRQPYIHYHRSKKRWWIIKGVVSALVIGAYVLFYFLFVKGA